MREKGAIELLKKQLTGLMDHMPNFLDMKTGQLKVKKVKKEKSPEDLAILDIKKMQKKRLCKEFAVKSSAFFSQKKQKCSRWKQLCTDLDTVQKALSDNNVRNCKELAPGLQRLELCDYKPLR